MPPPLPLSREELAALLDRSLHDLILLALDDTLIDIGWVEAEHLHLCFGNQALSLQAETGRMFLSGLLRDYHHALHIAEP